MSKKQHVLKTTLKYYLSKFYKKYINISNCILEVKIMISPSDKFNFYCADTSK